MRVLLAFFMGLTMSVGIRLVLESLGAEPLKAAIAGSCLTIGAFLFYVLAVTE